MTAQACAFQDDIWQKVVGYNSGWCCCMDWRDIYVEREVDKRLQELFQVAKKGRPQFVVLLAETGWGKTRAVQHFYEELRRREDAVGYWAERLTEEPDELRRARRSAVNPPVKLDAPVEQIPYLWWGIRFSNELRASGVSAYLHYLEIHAVVTTLKDQIQKHKKEQSRQMSSIAMDATQIITELLSITPIGKIHLLLSLIRLGIEVVEIRKKLCEYKKLECSVPSTLAEVHEHECRSLSEEVMQCIHTVLNASMEREGPTSIVIVLDDAQWADADSLSVIENLWREAQANSWPILFVATHWTGDYRKYQMRDRVQDPTPRLPDLRAYTTDAGDWHEIDLSQRIQLIEVTRAAFRRMCIEQAIWFTQLADGHPLYLRELITHAKRHPAWFDNRDVEGNMTSEGQDKCQKFRSLWELARRRFEEQPEEVRFLLALGSLQGMQFLHRITRALMEDQSFEPCYSNEHHDSALAHAHREALLDALQQIDGSEFDQVAFYNAAQEYLAAEPEAVKLQIRESLRHLLAQYVDTNTFASLPEAEQIPLLSLAVRELRPYGMPEVSHPDWQIWAKAAYLLFERLEAARLWIQMSAVALQLVPENLPAEGWSLETIGFWEQYRLFYSLLDMCGEQRAALRLAEGLCRRLESLDPESNEELLCQYAAALLCLGDALVASGDWASAHLHYNRSLNISQVLVDRQGETAKNLRDLSVAMERVGDGLRALGSWSEARKYYERSLQVRREIIERFGKTYQSLRDLSVALNRVGEGYRAARQWDEAMACYLESLQVRRDILQYYGETQQSLRDLSIALNRVGEIYRVTGNWSEVMRCYLESLQIRRKILQNYGETLESLRDLSAALLRVGDACASLNDWSQAQKYYDEGLQVRREILKRYGETQQSLRDLSVALERVGDARSSLQHWTEARKYYEESLTVRQGIVQRFGETQQSLRDLLVSHALLAQCYASLGERGTACWHAREAHRIAEQLHHASPNQPQTAQDLQTASYLLHGFCIE